MRFTKRADFRRIKVKSNLESRGLVLMTCLLLLGAYPVVSQDASAHPYPVEPRQESTSPLVEQSTPSTAPAEPEAQTKKEKKEKRGAIVIAPIPISNPALGSGVVVVAGYIFPLSRKDKISPPSVIGSVGLFTSNESRAFAFGGQLYFKENTYKLTTGYARGNLNYDLYGSREFTGLKLPLKQNGQGYFVQFQRRIAWKFFLGPQFQIGSSTLTPRPTGAETPPLPPDIGVDTTLTAIGVLVTRDTSSNRFYPTNGTYFSFTSNFFSKSLGSHYSFQTYRTSFAKYWGLAQKHVLAYNAFFCATGGEPPFYGNCIYGNSNQLRGYVAGKYFDRYMATTQFEYRLAWPWRFGFVAFGGVGEAIAGGDTLLFRNNYFLPSGGGGVRFVVSKAYHVNLRADIAQGKDGHTFIMGVGESF
jgi:hypothetical protein